MFLLRDKQFIPVIFLFHKISEETERKKYPDARDLYDVDYRVIRYLFECRKSFIVICRRHPVSC